jgi:hypothetical protein
MFTHYALVTLTHIEITFANVTGSPITLLLHTLNLIVISVEMGGASISVKKEINVSEYLKTIKKL